MPGKLRLPSWLRAYASWSGPHGWKEALSSVRDHVKADRVNVAAGAFAYRWFLALFPIVIALLGVAALVTIPRHVVVSLINGATSALPAAAAKVFTGAISHSDQQTRGELVATILAAAVGLWSATSGMVMLEEGLDMAYELPRDRSFLAKRLLAIPLLAGTILLGGSASALVIFGRQLGHAIKGAVPIGGSEFADGWSVLRWVVALALMLVLFSLLYYLAPNRERGRWRWAGPGAVVGTAVWALVSLGFSYYTSSFGSYGSTYGAFAGVAILIFWLYLTGLAVLVGGELNAAFERLTAGPPEVVSPPAERRHGDRVRPHQMWWNAIRHTRDARRT